MKSNALLVVFLGGVLVMPPATAEAAAVITGRACVIDGDSLAVGGARKAGRCRGGVEIRLHGIDAPEWNQTCKKADGRKWPCGAAATKAMRRLTAGGNVTCRMITRDRYRRVVARCLGPGGRDIEAALVAEGLAIAYRRYSRDYVADELAAKRAKRGIWAGEFMPPSQWRRREKRNKKH